MTVYSLGYCVMRKNLALFFLPSLLPYTNVWGEELQDATLKEVVVTATPTYHLAELPLIGLAVFLFGYFAVKGRLPKPFQR